MSSKVLPISDSPRDVGIPLASLNPDTDGDGSIEPWEKEVYDRIVAADTDNTGTISVRNLFDFIHQMSAEVKDAATGGIPIASLNPDSDGDGKVEKWEVEVFDRIKAADADQSGSISVKELFCVIKGAAESDKAKRLFRRLFGVALIVIFLLVGAMLGMGIVSGEAIKESRNPNCDAGECDPNKVVSVGSVESFLGSIFDLPAVPTNQLAYLKSITMYVDMTGTASAVLPAALVEFSFKLAGAFKSSDTTAYLVTDNGYTIKLDRAALSGTITIEGETFPVTNAPSAAARRSLQTSPDQSMVATLSGRQLMEHHKQRRELQFAGNFGGALLTTGSFTMMAASGGFRRKLTEVGDEKQSRELQFGAGNFGGASLTTGSFTMMAAFGGF